jgi:hypothetical protein
VVPWTEAELFDQAAFSAEYGALAQSKMMGCVTPSSNAKYKNDWANYKKFMARKCPRASLDQLLLVGLTLRQQVDVIVQYICYAVKELKLRPSTVNGSLSGIAHYFRSNYQLIDVFTHPSVRAQKTSWAIDERLNSSYDVVHKKQPLTLDMIDNIVDQAAFNRDNMVDTMIGVAATLAFFCLLRVSEYVPGYTKIELDEDGYRCHAITARDVLFEVASLTGEESEFVPSHKVTADMWPRVITVKITLRSMKNDQSRVGSAFWFSNLPEINDTTNIVRVLFEWAVRARLGPKSYFMSFRQGSGKNITEVRLTYERISTAIKNCATRYGLDPAQYGTHSCRIGGASHLRAAGAQDSEILRQGRWRSLPCSIGYQNSSFQELDNIQRRLQDKSVFTVRDLILTRVHPVGIHGSRSKYRG